MDWQMGAVGAIFKKDSVLQEYKQRGSASLSEPVDTERETQNDCKPRVQEELC